MSHALYETRAEAGGIGWNDGSGFSCNWLGGVGAVPPAVHPAQEVLVYAGARCSLVGRSGGRAVRVGGRVTALNAACLVLPLCSWECVVALGSAHAPHNCAVARLSYLRGQILAMWCFPRRRRPRHAECDGPRQCGVGAAADRFSRAVRRTTGTWPNGQRTAAAADRRRQEARLGHPDSSNCCAH